MSRPLRVAVCVAPAGEPSGGITARALAPLDLRAVEEALRLTGDTGSVIAMMVGGEQQIPVLREALALGVSEVVRVEAPADQLDGLSVAHALAAAVRSCAPDLVLAGSRSERGMHGVVPMALAHELGWPFVGAAVGIEVIADGMVRATQWLERGDRWTWEAEFPAIVAVERDLNEPRYLALRRLARASGADVAVVAGAPDAADRVGALVVEKLEAPRVRPKKAKAPPKTMTAAERMKFMRSGGQMSGAGAAAGDDDTPRRVSGPAPEAARAIVKLLETRGLL